MCYWSNENDLSLAAEVRMARSLCDDPSPEAPEEMIHDDMDAISPSPLNNPNLIVLERSSVPPAVPETSSVPSDSAAKDVDMADIQTPAVEIDETVDDGIDSNWNAEVNFVPETSASNSDALPGLESLNGIPGALTSQSSQAVDDQSGFAMHQGLNLRLESPSPASQPSASMPKPPEPSSSVPRPKPKPAPLKPGDVIPDAWAILGRRLPRWPAPFGSATRCSTPAYRTTGS